MPRFAIRYYEYGVRVTLRMEHACSADHGFLRDGACGNFDFALCSYARSIQCPGNLAIVYPRHILGKI